MTKQEHERWNHWWEWASRAELMWKPGVPHNGPTHQWDAADRAMLDYPDLLLERYGR